MALNIGQTSTVKFKLISTFIMVFAIVAQPLYGVVQGKVANAISNIVIVNTASEMVAAAADSTVTGINVQSDITVPQKLVLSGRNVTVDGNGHVLTLSGDTPGWQGNYVVQAYKTIVEIKNLTITGGDAAVYANGSTVVLKGTVNVSGNEFGGIEVSQGSGVTTPAVLNATAATVINSTEANAKPTAWIDYASVANATVNGAFTQTTHIGADQKQYYLNATNANIVVTNSTTGETFATIQAAIDDTNTVTGNVIVLNKDITLAVSVKVTKGITIDGANHTVAASFVKTGNDNNSAINVLSDNVTLNNLVVDGVTGTNLHGVNVYRSDNVAINNLTAKNSNVGLVVNGSGVTVNGIHTQNNGWLYGINVDKGDASHLARLTISGANSHTEPAAIWLENPSAFNTVVDLDNQYTQKTVGSGHAYILNKAPIATVASPAENGIVSTKLNGDKLKITGTFTDDTAVNYLQLELVKDGNLVTVYTMHYSDAGLNPDGTFSVNIPVAANIADGAYSLYYTGTDFTGGVTARMERKFVIDNLAPAAPTSLVWKTTTNVVVPNNGATNVYGGTASWTGSSDVDHYMYKYWNDISGNQYKVGSEYVVSTASLNIPGVFNQGEGVHRFCIAAVDAAGNTSVCTQFAINYDATAPQAPTLTSPMDNTPINGTSPLANNWEAVAGAHHYMYQSYNVDAAGVCNLASIRFTANYTNSETNTRTLADGLKYCWRVKAVDTAGNMSDWSSLWKTVVDNQDPTVVVDAIAGITQGDPAQVTGTVDDPSTITVEAFVDGLSVGSANVVGGAFSFTLNGLDTGSHDIIVVAKDAANNEGTSPVKTVIVSAPAEAFVARGEPAAPSPVIPAVQLIDNNAEVPVADGQEVLGAQDVAANDTQNEASASDTEDNVSDVMGINDTKDNSTFSPFGFAWYWWLAVLAAIAGLWWLIAARKRRKEDN